MQAAWPDLACKIKMVDCILLQARRIHQTAQQRKFCELELVRELQGASKALSASMVRSCLVLLRWSFLTKYILDAGTSANQELLCQ